MRMCACVSRTLQASQLLGKLIKAKVGRWGGDDCLEPYLPTVFVSRLSVN